MSVDLTTYVTTRVELYSTLGYVLYFIFYILNIYQTMIKIV